MWEGVCVGGCVCVVCVCGMCCMKHRQPLQVLHRSVRHLAYLTTSKTQNLANNTYDACLSLSGRLERAVLQWQCTERESLVISSNL